MTSSDQAISGAEIAIRSGYSPDELSGIETWEDVSALLDQHGETVTVAEDLGDGFAAYGKDKSGLVGKPLFILSVSCRLSDEYPLRDKTGNVVKDVNGDPIPTPFSTIRFVIPGAVASDPVQKYFMNDGSTGIHQQLQDLLRKRFGDAAIVDEQTFVLPDGTGHTVTVYAGKVSVRAAKGLRVSEYELPQGGKGKTYYVDTSAIAS